MDYPGYPSRGDLAPRGSDYLRQGGPEDIRSYSVAAPGTLPEYYQILRRHKWTVILIAMAGALAGIFTTLFQTPVYEARILMEIQDLNDNFMNLKQVSPVSEGGGWGGQSDIQTQIKILQSENLIKRAMAKVKENGASDRMTSETGLTATLRRVLHLPAPAWSDTPSLVDLKVRVLGQTRIIETLCDSTHPSFAAGFLNTLAQEYTESNMEARWNTSQRTAQWLTRQLEEMRRKLEHSENDLQNYARRSGLMFMAEKNNVSDEKLRQLQQELSRAQADRIATQSRYEMTSTSQPDALPEVLNDTLLRALQDKLTDLRRQRADLITIYMEKSDRVRRIDAQIAPEEAELQRQRAAIIDRIHNEYVAALRREQILANDYGNQSRLVTDQAEKSVQYNILKREVDSNRQLYEAMLQRVQETSIASAMRASNVRVIDPAEPPQVPYKPSLKVNAALGLLTGFMLAAGLVFVRERMDLSLRAPGEARSWLNLPELGVIPTVKGGKRMAIGRPQRSMVASASSHPLQNGNGPTALPGEMELITWNRRPSLIADSFRAILTSILFSGENGSYPRVLLVTSAGPGEGKTTIVSNLAIVLAQLRRRVLIIDGDLRKPRMHQVFAIPNERGLSSILSDDRVAPDAFDGIIHETPMEGLYILPSGPPSQSAGELVYSGVLPELLSQLKSEFDTVLIDSPPILPVPDARVIGRYSDAVVLVAKANHTSRNAVSAARQILFEDGARVLGLILNDWNPKFTAGRYGYADRNYQVELNQFYGGNGKS
jgi:capsular exopolysaccharide synthesis family protein